MGVTQKYKQQQQQVRVQTGESNYIKGMYYTDVPLAEGYSKTLINFDIDSLSGKLTPRKGLQSLGVIHPTTDSKQYLDNTKGYNILARTKVCASSDTIDRRRINKLLQGILYNTDSRALNVFSCDSEISEDNKFKITPFSLDSTDEFITPEPFIIADPQIHGKKCTHNNFFKKPVGTFAFGNSYYTFLKRYKYTVEKIAELPTTEGIYANIPSYAVLAQSIYATGGTPGTYFKFVSGVSAGTLAYYDTNGNIQLWERSEEDLQLSVFLEDTEKPETRLCYTKLGAEIQPDEILLDETIDYANREMDKYYVCVVEPNKLNPTEASSWGYNMLLENPYDFECEDTAVNNITILGILPYDNTGLPCLTPRKNQEITLKGFYRAPAQYHSDTENAKYYSTAKQRITITEKDENEEDVTVTRDPKTVEELKATVTDLTKYNYGDWWYCTEEDTYYMVIPGFTEGAATATKSLELFGNTKPAASEKLAALNTTAEDSVRVRWQIRSAGASDWIDIYNETTKLSEYYARHNGRVPFTVTTTLPAEEVLVKLTISDPGDIVANEEYVLSTNTIGISLVSDELANTLNLTANTFDLSQATGMCEWEQRLVLWGVPGALNTLFISDVNNPAFFPYPNNIDTFTDPIIAVHNYGNELLVLTAAALYRLTWDTEGTGWTHKLVQQNLHVTLEDTYISRVIKNMFFFKSGEHYYMMVPKTNAASVRGDVAIAPISKPIEGLLNNFHSEIHKLVDTMVDQQTIPNFTNYLVNYFSYVDSTKIIINYVYDLNATIGNTESITDSKYLYVQLIYDTDVRTWSMRIFEAPHMLYASHEDAIQQDRFIDVTPALNGDNLVLQYYKFVNIVDDSVQYIAETGAAQASTKLMKNYQYLDTGNREINTDLKKRFREFQFKLKNLTANNLGFFTSFLIDGSVRKDLQKYSPRFILDNETGEATVVVERVLDPATMTYNTTRVERILIPERMLQDSGELALTTLSEEKTDPDQWILNQSAFPGRTFWKIRMPISGKGYTPRVIFLSTNEREYELLGHLWVYRTMNSR